MRNRLALWAGISGFIAAVLSITIIDIFTISESLRYLAGLVVGLITWMAVYFGQEKSQEGIIRIEVEGDKQIYSLELDGDPRDLENKQEVRFKVRKQ